ncbi:MAG: ATP-binding protein, partial [Phycisphaerae bacterium]
MVGRKVDRIWAAYISESDPKAKASLVQALELLAVRHLDQGYQPDRSPFPPPPRELAGRGDVTLGQVTYAGKELFPFSLRADRLKEHMLICGRSGSGKTNLTFLLMRGLMARGIHVLAMDWKRGYRDLLQVREDLRVYTIGREISPFRFNPFIPPPGIEAGHWGKLIVDVIASAYFGGEGVISLLVSGLDHLYHECGAHEGLVSRWPVVADLLAWLRETKLTGRAAMWKASAERILVAMTYGEFGAVLNCQDNRDVRGLLNHNVVLEMDGLSSNSDRVLFSEALTLYLYRQRLAEGPRDQLANVIILEEAHNLLLGRQPGGRESVLENSIRMIRQYGLGYVFVDQSASMLSKVAFANSYATVALSQKLKGDVQAMASAMNLADEQRQALSTLPIGSAVVRLADEHPEPFLIQAPLCGIQEGLVGDDRAARSVPGDSGDSASNTAAKSMPEEITDLPPPDKKGISSMDPRDHRSHPPPESTTRSKEASPTHPPMNNP